MQYLIFNQYNKCSIDFYENLVAQHFLEYVEDDQLLKLNIPILYRILKNYYKISEENKGHHKTENDCRVLDFIFKYCDFHGKYASILFSLSKFPIDEAKYVDLLLDLSQKDKIDFQFLNSELAKILQKKKYFN